MSLKKWHPTEQKKNESSVQQCTAEETRYNLAHGRALYTLTMDAARRSHSVRKHVLYNYVPCVGKQVLYVPCVGKEKKHSSIIA